MTFELHDATLRSVEVDWPGRSAALSFRRGDSTVTLVVSSLTRLDLPRAESWGPSNSVYCVKQTGGDGTPVRLLLEMQSGDVLVAEGANIEWIDSDQNP